MSVVVVTGRELDLSLRWVCEVISVNGDVDLGSVVPVLFRRAIGICSVDYLSDILDFKCSNGSISDCGCDCLG
jgi:hypothetical protein